MTWVLWAALLLAQNAAFTMVSRARNSGSILYNGIASVFSNGIWIVNQVLVVDILFRALKSGNTGLIAFAVVFYTTFTVLGSVGMHYFLMNKVERGKLKVGA